MDVRVRVEVSGADSDEAFSFSGEGALDTASQRASFSVEVSSSAALPAGSSPGSASRKPAPPTSTIPRPRRST